MILLPQTPQVLRSQVYSITAAPRHTSNSHFPASPGLRCGPFLLPHHPHRGPRVGPSWSKGQRRPGTQAINGTGPNKDSSGIMMNKENRKQNKTLKSAGLWAGVGGVCYTASQPWLTHPPGGPGSNKFIHLAQPGS